MADTTEYVDRGPSIAGPVFVTIALVVALFLLIAVTGELSVLRPYARAIVIVEIVVIGIFIIENVGKVIFGLAVRRTTVDVAAALKIIARITAYGVMVSAVVSVLTANAAAALTIGSFAGLVAGFASQTVMGNAIAGMFMVIARPIRIGNRVTIGPNAGTVKNISLMHVTLDTEDREILIPSSTTVNSVLVRHKATS